MKEVIKKYKQVPIQVKASFWFLVCAFFQKAISSLSTPIFTRLLSTEEFGQYSVFNSWLSIITIIISLNLWGGVYMQGMVKYENEKEQFSSSLQGLTFILVILWSIVYICFYKFWNALFSLTTLQMILLLLMVWTTSVFNFWSSEQRVNFNYKKLVIITISVSALKPIVGIVFVLFSRDKVTARIISVALVELIFYSGCFFDQLKRGGIFYSKKYWKYVMLFAVPLLPHYLSSTILNSADRIMISNMVGDSEAGIYSLAYSISLIMTMFNTALYQTIEPWIYKKIKTNEIESISPIAYISFITIAFVNLLLIVLTPEVVYFFAPVEYYDAVWLIPPIAMSVFFSFAYTFFATFEFYFEKKICIVMATLSGAVLNIILNYYFIQKYGYFAAGYTTLVCYILYSVMHYIFMRAICKEKLNNRQPYKLSVLLLISVLFIVLGFAFMLTYYSAPIRYSIVVFFSILMLFYRRKIYKIIKKITNIKMER